MKKLIISLFIILIISCSSQDSLDVNSANEQGILLLDNGTEPQGLDPHIVTGVTEHKIVIALFEGLTMQNPKGEGVIPAAAESWNISEDGLEIIFNIRTDARWSNGDPLTAQDFVYSWRRILTPALGSRYPDMLYAVKNAEQFNKSEIENFDLVGVKALDSKTLKVNLKKLYPNVINLCNKLNIFELASVAKESQIIIGNDTGPMHLFAILRCKLIVLFTKYSKPALCAPRGKKVKIINHNSKDFTIKRIEKILNCC